MKEQMVQQVERIIATTAMRIDLEYQRLPTPNEFAKDIVDYFYEAAKGTETQDKTS